MEVEVNHIARLVAPRGSLQRRRHVQLVPQRLGNLDRDEKNFDNTEKNLVPNCLRGGGGPDRTVLVLHRVEDLVQVVHVSVPHQRP